MVVWVEPLQQCVIVQAPSYLLSPSLKPSEGQSKGDAHGVFELQLALLPPPEPAQVQVQLFGQELLQSTPPDRVPALHVPSEDPHEPVTTALQTALLVLQVPWLQLAVTVPCGVPELSVSPTLAPWLLVASDAVQPPAEALQV